MLSFCQSRPDRRVRRLAIAAGIAVAMCGTAVADDVIAETSGTSYVHAKPKGWQGETRRDRLSDGQQTSDASRPDAAITVRVYERPGRLRPYLDNEPLVGVDVTAEIETCADGNDRIDALHIGGQRYVVDGDCPAGRRATRADPRDDLPQDDAEPAAETELRCDPATWRCRITGH